MFALRKDQGRPQPQLQKLQTKTQTWLGLKNKHCSEPEFENENWEFPERIL